MKNIIAAVLVLLLLEAKAIADENPGVTAAPILQVPMGSRALGMGGAFTAVASDPSTLYYNPAGLALLGSHEVGFTFISGLSDNTLQHLAYGGPLPFKGLSGGNRAAAGASLLWSQSGSIEVNRTNPDGSFLNSENLSAGSDLVLSLAYAEKLASTPIESKDFRFGIDHYAGLSGKILRSTLVEQYSAAAATVDAGYLAKSTDLGASFGASLLNIGGKLKYLEVSDPLPTIARLGFAYDLRLPAAQNMILASDAEYLLKEKRAHVNAGLEYFWQRNYGLRLGYQFLRDTLGLTAGFSLKWREKFVFDYAWAMGSSLNNSHRFTVSYRFGRIPGARPKAAAPAQEITPSIENGEPQKIEDSPQETPGQVLPSRPSPDSPDWIY
jgi:hypothetical protein